MKRIIKNALGFNFISILILIRGGISRFSAACEAAFASVRLTNCQSKIPEITLPEILRGASPILKLIPYPYEDGILPFYQSVALLTVLVHANPKTVLEIGTYKGHTTRLIAENLPQATVHTVDLPVSYNQQNDASPLPKDDFHLIGDRVVGREFRGRPCENNIVQHLVDTAIWDFKDAGRPQCFFIDGSHTYEYCKNDSEKCLALCDGPAVFLWHDCDHKHPGVIEFLQEWRKTGRDIRCLAGTPIAYWQKTA